MTDKNFNVYDYEGISNIFVWEKVVGPPEESALEQLRELAAMPFIHKHVAVMPDVHWGMGSTIGSVFATSGAIIPAGVGVDIGCGMTAARLPITSHALPEDCQPLHDAIDAAIPNGRTDNGGKNDKGAWRYRHCPDIVDKRWKEELEERFEELCEKRGEIRKSNNHQHLGSLGTGNHFIELCLDTQDRVWVLLHSGSRGVGNKIASVYMREAKKLCEQFFVELPNPHLAYLPNRTEAFGGYVQAVHWAQDFARISREIMMALAIDAVNRELGFDELSAVETISCHHNYIAQEHHFGKDVWVTRKGAVRAREGDIGIIPGSMGKRSHIVKGLGNKLSFCSCSHGAGRRMSRRKARETITLEEHAAATEGVACRKGEEVLDESPAAYKDIDAVMASQTDLVEIVETLKQFVCVKGA